jgi:hypothetical protein
MLPTARAYPPTLRTNPHFLMLSPGGRSGSSSKAVGVQVFSPLQDVAWLPSRHMLKSCQHPYESLKAARSAIPGIMGGDVHPTPA